MDRIYLDHNATTPIDPGVIEAMEPYLREIFGNPSSVVHEDGHAAARAIAMSRALVADAIGARENEIVFTGSCTEADNLAIFGMARANPGKKHLVTTAIEHPAILEPARALEREGWRVTYVPVGEDGRVSVSAIADSLCDDTALVSVMGANNEVGSLQPIQEIGALCAARGVIFHTDLAQIAAYGDIDVERDNIHLASLSAHKAYGPKGIGALYVRARRPRVKLTPILFGGGQERGLRPGTLNTAGIVGMGTAMAIAKRTAKSEAVRLSSLCTTFRDAVLEHVPGALLNGHPTERLPNNLSFSIPGLEPLALMRRLRDQLSFSASSACATDKIETSHVLLAMFGDTERARGAFRIAPGRFTTEAQMSAAASLIIEECTRLRRSEPMPARATA
ncbi:cysteine desulfurase DndA [Mesorhizobium loti]|uniref:cysteine desulfurase family protein n=1 Tax=Mesorhizobium TaxID=68287 RepID=UPI000BAF3D92|nr:MULTISPECIES: aminotransferase class V-fold PLP-dependent enzyme [Mesorhizobium]PBB14188.1 cysteine desulfurase DndA [Mesorhizobium loti]PBC07336.1 cysteine desulfurase DndA [Mesorhizobium sp. WSM3859]